MGSSSPTTHSRCHHFQSAVSARVTYAARETLSRPSSPAKSIRSSSPVKRVPTQVLPTVAPPPSRPRAKVSSSANVTAGRKPIGSLTPGYASGTSTPRAPSPFKQFDLFQGRLSPKPSSSSLSRMRSTISAASAPSSPLGGNAQPAHSVITATTSESTLAKPSPPRVRHASISSISQLSAMSSARANSVLSPTSSVVSSSHDSDTQSNVSTKRFKAKVTGIALGNPPAALTSLLIPSPTPSPPNVTPQVRQRIGRTASISLLPSANDSMFYPITTSSPVANVHRFAATRTPSASNRPLPCFSSPLHSEHIPHVDPSLVPLPLHSPPSSNVSSSHSSASRSSFSSASRGTVPTVSINGTFDRLVDHKSTNGQNGHASKSRSNSLVVPDAANIHEGYDCSTEGDSDEVEEERTIKAEAKSVRKIADLEISNKSLLAINAQLEANKHKQAKEIRELRRKLRESRLVLPPRTYRALELSTTTEDFHNDDEEEEDKQEEEEDEEDNLAEIIKLGKDDELFNRVQGMLDNLLETGRQALLSKIEDFAPPRGAAKVLHEEEARSWRDGRRGSDSGSRTPAERDLGDDTFDETFVTADSGDDPDGQVRRVGFRIKEKIAKSEGLMAIVVKNIEPIAAAYS
ncbi:hypothetical protein EW145_g2757 [Phellinidium pouzarii]|uniref:Uncharacterized protein n=1 Tax=Phellinidium pouzarii TaxID=167371 RepID=A0A4S4L9J6_9AGAM|nr:hypothetical protein EW145_g2757 [Phellinidium pouzarii]